MLVKGTAVFYLLVSPGIELHFRWSSEQVFSQSQLILQTWLSICTVIFHRGYFDTFLHSVYSDWLIPNSLISYHHKPRFVVLIMSMSYFSVSVHGSARSVVTRLSMPCLWLPHYALIHWLAVSPSQFKFDGKFVSFSTRFYWSDRYKILYMAWQLCCTNMQKFVAIWRPVTELQQGEFAIEFELRAKFFIETAV